jgi:hypothetical protein
VFGKNKGANRAIGAATPWDRQCSGESKEESFENHEDECAIPVEVLSPPKARNENTESKGKARKRALQNGMVFHGEQQDRKP